MRRARRRTALALWLFAATATAGCRGGGRRNDAGAPGDAAPTGDADAAGAADGGPGLDGGPGTDGGPAGSVAEAYCSTVVPAACNVIFSCCDATMQAMYGSEAACVADEMSTCLSWYAGLDDSAAAGRIVLDGAQLAACGLAFASLAMTCDASLGGVVALDCLPALVGQVPDGGACAAPVFAAEWLECASGSCVGGVCEPWPALGTDCPAISQCNIYEHRCVDDGTALTCQAPLADGAACTQDFECASIYCASPPAGVCQPFAGQDVCRDTG